MKKNTKITDKELRYKNRRLDLEEYHIDGYFFNVGNSRSGHNYIKFNVLGFLGNGETRKYVNCENFDPTRFLDTYFDYDPNRYTNSVHVLVVRDLLNWFSSIVHFYFRNKIVVIENGEQVVLPVRNPKRQARVRGKVYEGKEAEKAMKDPKIVADNNVTFLLKGAQKRERHEGRHNIKLNDYINARLNDLLNIWMNQAKEYCNETNLLPYFTSVYYDEFVVSEEYRKAIAKKVGGEYTNQFLDVVPLAGGGSSFDKGKFDGRGSQMKVLERFGQWNIRGVKDKKIFLRFLKNHKAYQYYLDNFPVSKEKKKYIDSIK